MRASNWNIRLLVKPFVQERPHCFACGNGGFSPSGWPSVEFFSSPHHACFRDFPMSPLPACRAALGPIFTLGLLSFACAQSPAASASDPVEGTWLGTVTAPQGPADIGFRFERDAQGALAYALQFPVMNAYGVKFGAPVGRNGEAYTEPVFQSRLMLAGDRLTGTFGPGKLPVDLVRGGCFSPAPPAPHYPAAPAPLWTHALGSLTWAPPVVADGNVYVGARDNGPRFSRLHV